MKLNAPLALTCLFFFSGQPAFSNETEKLISIATFAAPAQFQPFLDAFQKMDGTYDITTDWTSIYDANYIVIFSDSRDDANFVPAVIRPAFQKAVSTFTGFSYFLPVSVFKGTLQSDVQILISDEFVKKLNDDIPGFDAVISSKLIPCLMAGTVSDQISENTNSFSELYSICGGFINGR